MQLTTSGGKMSGEGGEKAAVTSYCLEVLLAAMLGGGRGKAKPVLARLLTDTLQELREVSCNDPFYHEVKSE